MRTRLRSSKKDFYLFFLIDLPTLQGTGSAAIDATYLANLARIQSYDYDAGGPVLALEGLGKAWKGLAKSPTPLHRACDVSPLTPNTQSLLAPYVLLLLLPTFLVLPTTSFAPPPSFTTRNLATAARPLFATATPSSPLFETRAMKKHEGALSSINSLEAKVEDLSDSGLVSLLSSLRSKPTPSSEVETTFAVAREAAWRTLQLRPYDVQILGGLTLHSSKVCQMATGEGKTLTTVFPALQAWVEGRGR